MFLFLLLELLRQLKKLPKHLNLLHNCSLYLRKFSLIKITLFTFLDISSYFTVMDLLLIQYERAVSLLV